VYDQCLFFNPHVKDVGQAIYCNYFLKYQLTHHRDVTYEVIPDFLPLQAIIEKAHYSDPFHADIRFVLSKINYYPYYHIWRIR